jgi:hypothetical protein
MARAFCRDAIAHRTSFTSTKPMVDCLSLHCIHQAADAATARALSDDRRSGLSVSSGSIDHDLAAAATNFLVAALTRFHSRFTCRIMPRLTKETGLSLRRPHGVSAHHPLVRWPRHRDRRNAPHPSW